LWSYDRELGKNKLKLAKEKKVMKKEQANRFEQNGKQAGGV